MFRFHRQQGAVVVTVAFTLLFLLGFMGFALDFGHMFVVKDEMQTSMDACALAAVQELDGNSDALTRATNAGMAAGNLNRVNFQSATWSGQGRIVAANITFKDDAYSVTTLASRARYAQCAHTQNGIQMWLIQAMGAFAGSTSSAYANTASVGATAVATLAAGQSACPIPVAIKPKAGGVAPNYGFAVGEWVRVLGSGGPGSGEVGWYNLDGSSSASEAATELGEPSRCGTKISDNLGTPGAKNGVADVWNARFGLYRGSASAATMHPDLSGYAYTTSNWKNASPQNAYAGSPVAGGTDPNVANFQTMRANLRSYANGTSSSRAVGDGWTGLTTNSFKPTTATPGVTGDHGIYGYNRRIAAVPVINAAASVVDFVCMFMLAPIDSPPNNPNPTDVYLEFEGNAALAGSPCASSGLAGAAGGAGVKVPVLVQ